MPVLEQARQAAPASGAADRDHSSAVSFLHAAAAAAQAQREMSTIGIGSLARHRAADLDDLSLAQADRLGHAVDRRRLPGRAVDFLARCSSGFI